MSYQNAAVQSTTNTSQTYDNTLSPCGNTPTGVYTSAGVITFAAEVVGTSPPTITDASSGFVAAGFVATDYIIVTGAADAANNGVFIITDVAADVLTLACNQTLVSRASGAGTVGIEIPSSSGMLAGGITAPSHHGSLTGLTDDDHTQYRLESADHTHQTTGAQAGQLDHGLAMDATSLTHDDHTIYLLATGARDISGDQKILTDKKIIFRDAALYIYSSADGWVNIAADGGVEINAPVLNVATLYSAGDVRFQGDTLLYRYGTNSSALLTISTSNDQPTYGSQLILQKSNSDTLDAVAETQDGDTLAILTIKGVSSTPARAPGFTITAVQDGASGAGLVPTTVSLETRTVAGTNTGQLVLDTDGTVSMSGLVTMTAGASLPAAANIALATTTGTKIGTATNQLLGFYNKTPVDQPAAVADSTDAASVILRLNELLARMRELGLIAT